MTWKDGLLNSYASAQGLPSIDWPVSPDPQHPPLFRRASTDCARVVDWRSGSGRNRAGEPGWVHIAECRTPAGADMQVVEIGRAHVRTPVTNAHLVCRLLLEKKKRERTSNNKNG